MLIKFDLESDLFKHIEELIKAGKYEDILQFIKIAISNQLQEEKAGTQVHEVFEESYVSQPSKLAAEIGEQNKIIQAHLEDLLKNISHVKLPVSDFEQEEISLIWSFYNRFLPIKIIIYQLADSVSPEQPWFDLEELRETAVIIAQDWCRVLKEYESEKQISRNKRLSIGLPLHPVELENLKRKKDVRKMENKITSGKKRFMNQFIGRYYKNDETFGGACFELGLISVKLAGNRGLVSLTELGKELAILENPILHERNFDKAFSNQEMKLIYKKIIPQFKLEKRLVDDVVNKLKIKKLGAKDTDPIFGEYEKEILEFYFNEPEKLTIKRKEEVVVQSRVATMGRLAELGIVNWDVDRSGYSHYSLNKEKAAFLGLN